MLQKRMVGYRQFKTVLLPESTTRDNDNDANPPASNRREMATGKRQPELETRK